MRLLDTSNDVRCSFSHTRKPNAAAPPGEGSLSPSQTHQRGARLAGMRQAMVNIWWLFLLRGVAALFLAAFSFIEPSTTWEAFVYVLGFYVFMSGMFAIWGSISGAAGNRWWAVFIEGLLAVAVAMIMWSMPEGTAQVFVYLFAAWAIVTGILEIAAGVQLRDLLGPNEWLYIVAGIIALAFGIWALRAPQQGATAEIWIIGVYAALYGVAQIAFSFRLRSLAMSVKAN